MEKKVKHGSSHPLKYAISDSAPRDNGSAGAVTLSGFCIGAREKKGKQSDVVSHSDKAEESAQA